MLPRRLAAAPHRGFVGRRAELATIGEVVDDLVAGRGPRILLIAGEQGTGKTAFAAQAARAAAAQGCVVAYGRGQEGLESHFGPWRQALGKAWPGPSRERDELFAAVVDHLATAASDGPLLVVLDDLQWADQASLLLIALVAGESTPGLCLMLCYRSTEADPASPLGALLASVGSEAGVVRVALAGLDQVDVEALMAADSGLDEETRVHAHRVWADSGGNAFFVNALLDELQASNTGATPSTLKEVIGHRVARLGKDAVAVLRVAAVLGEVFSTEIVTAVSGIDEPVVRDVLDSAMTDGLVTEIPLNGLSFVHALVADTLADSLSGPRRRAVHRVAAEALSSRGADPAVVARHLAAAQPGDRAGREAAVDAAVAAGSAAFEALAYEDAVARLTEAVRMVDRWGLDDDRRCTALLALVRAQRMGGQPDEAVPVAIAAVDLAVRLERWEEVERGLLHFPRTASAAPDPELVAVLQRASLAAPPTTTIRALALANLSWVLHYSGDEAVVHTMAEEALALADASGDRAARSYTRSMLLLARGGDPNPAAQLELVQTVEALWRPEDKIALRTDFELRLRRVHALLRMGDLEQMDREIQRAQATDQGRRRDELRWWILSLQAMRAVLEGRLEDGEALRDAAFATNSPYGAQAKAAGFVAQTFVIDYLRGCLGDLSATLASFAQGFPVASVRAALAASLACTDRSTEARELLAELAADDFAAIPRDDNWLTAACMLADACRLLDARPEAEALYAALQPYAGEYVVTSAASVACFGAVDRSLGQLSIVCGREDQARAHLDDAARLNARIGARPFLALTRVDQAALGVTGAAAEARVIAAELGLEVVLQRLGALEDQRTLSVEAPLVAGSAELRCQNGVWTVAFAGRSALLKDLLGLHYLRELLARPGRELHAVELQGGTGGGGTPMLDEAAKQAYRLRLEDLDDELEEAEAFGDSERAARAGAEREALAHEIARAAGLGGRARAMNSDSERARLNVSRALRAALGRIAEVHPELGQHLQLAVRTGTYCAYEPDPGLSITWALPMS